MGILSVSLALALGTATPALQAQESAVQISLQAQPLGQALLQLGRQASLQIFFAQDLVSGLSAPALSGELTPDQALQRLLAGTGIRYDRQGDRVTLSKGAGEAAQLEAVTVSGQHDGVTEGTGSYTTRSMSTATRLGLSPRDTPQSVSVITQQQIEDYNLQTLTDVMRYTPGVYVTAPGGISDQEVDYQIRGFGLDSIQIDGMSMDRGNFNSRTLSGDMAMYDRVEVLRGAAGLLQGVGTPAGSVNMVRKRPMATPFAHLSLEAGTHDRYGATVDAGTVLGESERVRGRFVANVQDNHDFVDVSHSTNRSVYGIVEIDLTDRTTLGIGGSYQRYRLDGIHSGTPTNEDGSPLNLPRSAFFGQGWSWQKRDTTTFFADLNHRFLNRWQAKLSVAYVTGKSDSVYPSFSRVTGNPDLRQLRATGWNYDTRQTAVEGTLNGPFSLFGREHELVLGVNYRKEDSSGGNGWTGAQTYVFDPYNLNPYITPDSGMVPNPNPMLWANHSENTGVFMTSRLSVTDSTKLILGGRLSWYLQKGTGWYYGPRVFNAPLKQRAEFTPYAGIVQDVDEWHSVYASYTQIFQPQGAVDVAGNQLDPMTGTNVEVGIKGEYFDGALNASLALYQMTQRNRAMRDEENCPIGGLMTCSRASGEIKSKGIDLEVSGALTPGWQLGGGYTYNIAKYTKDNNPANVGKRLNDEVPRHLFKMFTSYRPEGEWHRWQLGASVYMQSKIFVDEGVFQALQDGYAVFGLMASYQLNKQLSLYLNVDNVFDKNYRTGLGASWSGSGVRYGAPRNATLRAEYRM